MCFCGAPRPAPVGVAEKRVCAARLCHVLPWHTTRHDTTRPRHNTTRPEHAPSFFSFAARDQLGHRVYLPHRLDRGTSGCLLLGFSPEAVKVRRTACEAQVVLLFKICCR